MDRYIPDAPIHIDIYDETKPLIPIADFTALRRSTKSPLIPIVNVQGSLERKARALINMQPWLASLRGVLQLPPVLQALAPDFMLPPEFGMVAKSVQGILSDPTPIKIAFVAAQMPSMILQRTRGNRIWKAEQAIAVAEKAITPSIDRFITTAGQNKNKPLDLGKFDKFQYFSILQPSIKGRDSDKVDSFLGVQTNVQFIPNNLIFIKEQWHGQTEADYQKVKKQYVDREEEFKRSVLEYIDRRNNMFSQSALKYEKHNMLLNKDYLQQEANPLQYVLRTTLPARTAQTELNFGRGATKSSFVIQDPLSYQIESYRTSVFRNVNSAQDLKGTDFQGNLIKFWIKNLNDNSIMTTPAFITQLKDSGGNGTWDQFNYINSFYPKFTYKGIEKRVIGFTLKLACFDKTYFKQYVEKLNFLRTVGFPYYTKVEIPRTNKLGQESIIQGNASSLKVTLARAPLYSLTLGDIAYQQPGFFEECEFSWDDEGSPWNLDPRKMFGASNPNAGDFNDLISKIKSQEFFQLELPIITTINCSFVCVYGLGPSSNYLNQEYYMYDSLYNRNMNEYLKKN